MTNARPADPEHPAARAHASAGADPEHPAAGANPLSGASPLSGTSARPSAALAEVAWERAHAELVEELRTLIRLPTVNPPGDEIVAARHLAEALGDAGIPAEVARAVPGPRFGRRQAPRRRDRRAAAPAPLPHRRRACTARRLDPRSVRRRPRRRPGLGSGRRGHEVDGGDGARRHAAARRGGAGSRPRPSVTTRFRACAATSSSRRPRTKRPAGSRAPAGWSNTDQSCLPRTVPSTNAAASRWTVAGHEALPDPGGGARLRHLPARGQRSLEPRLDAR